MKKIYFLLFIMSASVALLAQSVYINEIHYDNASGDVGEFVELFVTNPQPGTLSDYQINLYNGSNGTSYDSETFDNMTQSASDDTNGFGTGRYYTWYPNSIQNGAPDGVASSGPDGLIEFLSYEGEFTGSGGPANGVNSINIGASESSSAGIGTSIQNNGTGTWVSGLAETPGENNINDILPVKLIFFQAKNRNLITIIKWQTSSEINNDRFEIERSTDAVRYETIGAVKGNGNSLKLNDYTFVDESPLTGINYYRLKQVDIDGRFDYSDMVSVEIHKSSIRITPTSTYDFVTVNTGAQSSIILRSVNGQVMNQQSNSEGNFTVEMAHYPQGIYFLTINMNGSIQTEKVVRL